MAGNSGRVGFEPRLLSSCPTLLTPTLTLPGCHLAFDLSSSHFVCHDQSPTLQSTSWSLSSVLTVISFEKLISWPSEVDMCVVSAILACLSQGLCTPCMGTGQALDLFTDFSLGPWGPDPQLTSAACTPWTHL